MHTRHAALLILPFLAFAGASHAAAETCASKQQKLETEIQYAQKHGNSHRVAGLKKALNDVKTHCTDAGLAAERQKKVEEKEARVQQRERELREAQEAGKTAKIADKQKKLDKAQAELQEAQARAK